MVVDAGEVDVLAEEGVVLEDVVDSLVATPDVVSVVVGTESASTQADIPIATTSQTSQERLISGSPRVVMSSILPPSASSQPSLPAMAGCRARLTGGFPLRLNHVSVSMGSRRLPSPGQFRV